MLAKIGLFQLPKLDKIPVICIAFVKPDPEYRKGDYDDNGVHIRSIGLLHYPNVPAIDKRFSLSHMPQQPYLLPEFAYAWSMPDEFNQSQLASPRCGGRVIEALPNV